MCAAEMIHLLGADHTQRSAWVERIGLSPYRAGQIGRWIFEKNADDFARMSDLNAADRRTCAASAEIYRGRVARRSVADDGTAKLLITWPDGESVETVWIPDRGRNTACLSSQVGCPVGCRFCASGLDGVRRNLTAGEIVEQAMHIRRLIGERGRLSNIVLMGMGEPLANYAAVVKAIRIINSSTGMGIAARKITLSTVGLPAQIKRLATEGLQINLALSLHAPDDTLRNQLVPVNRKTGLRAILQAAHRYFESTGRRITFEYVLLAGVNDQPEHAQRLVKLLRTYSAMINVIPYNPVAGLPYETPSMQAVGQFEQILQQGGINIQVRQRKGVKIDAACGQLRHTNLSGAVPSS